MHGGAADLIVVPARTAHVIPDGRLPSRSAVLAEPGVTALHSIRRTRPEPGCRALVVGADMVGCIAILPLLAEGAAVDVVETDPVRRALVEELGGQRVDPPTPDAYDVNALLLKDATLFGILNEPGLYDELLGIMARTPSAFDVLIDAEYPLSDGAAAMARLAGRGRTRPKVMLTVGT
jgi:threonine dehydrogenase-like Zn-dependent dehydrogenase